MCRPEIRRPRLGPIAAKSGAGKKAFFGRKTQRVEARGAHPSCAIFSTNIWSLKLALFDGGSEGEDLFCVQSAASEIHFLKKSIFPGKSPFFAVPGPS